MAVEVAVVPEAAAEAAQVVGAVVAQAVEVVARVAEVVARGAEVVSLLWLLRCLLRQGLRQQCLILLPEDCK